MKNSFSHETLIAYRLALGVARWLRSTRFPMGDSGLRDQGVRAACSCVLNLAEGASAMGGNRRKHFAIAKASAAETCAVLDLVELSDGAERQAELRRVAAMISGLR
jgi:four helix bundle protein